MTKKRLPQQWYRVTGWQKDAWYAKRGLLVRADSPNGATAPFRDARLTATLTSLTYRQGEAEFLQEALDYARWRGVRPQLPDKYRQGPRYDSWVNENTPAEELDAIEFLRAYTGHNRFLVDLQEQDYRLTPRQVAAVNTIAKEQV